MRTKNIHDQNFKHNFSKIEVVHDFLKYNSDPDLLKNLDLSTLKEEPTEYTTPSGKGESRADKVYSVKDKNREKIYAVFHLEGQSTPDKNMGIRIWGYQFGIALKYVKRGEKIPIILSFVLYHGKKKWTGARRVADLFHNFDAYVKYALKSPFLIDLTKAQFEELEIQEAAAAPQIIMMNQSRGDHYTTFARLWPILKRHNQADKQNIGYMAATDKKGEYDIIKKLAIFAPEMASELRTMFERVTKKAIQQGRQEGIITGRQEGITETIELLKREGLNEAVLEKVLKKLQ